MSSKKAHGSTSAGKRSSQAAEPSADGDAKRLKGAKAVKQTVQTSRQETSGPVKTPKKGVAVDGRRHEISKSAMAPTPQSRKVAEDEKGGDDDEEVDAEEEEEDDDDENGWGDEDIEELTEVEPRPPASKFAAPSHDELQQLKETDMLFKSNLFRMQVEEMIKEVSVDYEKQGSLEEALHNFRNAVLALPQVAEREVSATALLNGRVRVPCFEDVVGSALFKMRILPPTAVHVVGSFMLRTICKPELNIDLCLEMPKELFQAKDHLNRRYHKKRAYYLASVANHLMSKTEQFQDIQFSASPYDGDLDRPVLIIRPLNLDKRKRMHFTLRVFAFVESSVFKLSKLAPSRNNVRRRMLDIATSTMNDDHFGDEGASADDEIATPLYNNGLLSDMFMREHLAAIHEHLHDSVSGRETVLLLKVWLRRRHMGHESTDSLNGFTASMILAYLFRLHRLNNRMSSFQMLCVFMEFLSRESLLSSTNGGITMLPPHLAASEGLPSLTEFREHFDVVFVDPSGRVNLLAHMSSSSYLELQHEAKLASAALTAASDSMSNDSFMALFMMDITFAAKHDVVLTVSRFPSRGSFKHDPLFALERPKDWHGVARELMVKLLQKGLGDRAVVVRAHARKPLRWLLTSEPAYLDVVELDESTAPLLQFGLTLDPANALRVIDMGPSSDKDVGALAVFRALWGNKAELRRFQDGTLAEAVVWEVPARQRHLIVQSICAHLLSLHFHISPSRVLGTSGRFDGLLEAQQGDVGNALNDTNAILGFSHSVACLDKLTKMLRNLRESLPLSVASVFGACATFSYTEVFPPPVYASADHDSKKWTVPLDAVIEFESSSRWPDELEAVEHMKTAFLVRIAQKLRENYSLPVFITTQYLDVFIDGLMIRLHIHHARELLLRRTGAKMAPQLGMKLFGALTKDPQLALFGSASEVLGEQMAAVNSPLADVRALAVQVYFRPLHVSFMHGLVMRYPALSGAVRLAKRWVHSQMLSLHFPVEVVELLVAALFITPIPFAEPASPSAGFLRFLHLLCEFEWNTRLLLLNVDNTFSADDCATLRVQAEGNKQRRPMLIVTPQDRTGSLWTHSGPSLSMLKRAQALASASLSVLSKQSADPRIAFRAPLEEYNLLIHLRADRVANAFANIDWNEVSLAQSAGEKKDVQFKNLQMDSQKASRSPGVSTFNPVTSYVQSLQNEFDEFAVFCYDMCGGLSIGVVWKPSVHVTEPFRVSHARYKKALPVAKGEKVEKLNVTTNLEDIIATMAAMGEGLVEKIVKQ